ncbi:tachykinin-like peptides receptor 86C [Sitophilus oryzae]|uniref:Tachykinin-like peptides receptor 86C n=1 Tax=Sitophilus oryzae TaxID=7048 RepID=A0A6J2XVL5_SITOR|nr:tachykinin-like peptides receptor 86C [Sitophilus oryzae]
MEQMDYQDILRNVSSEMWPLNKSYEGLDYGPIIEQTLTKESNSELPFWVQAAWTSVFALMILIATGGNCIVIWIVIAHRRMRTVTNYFLVNLSTADLLLTLFNCIFNSIYMIQRNWPFGTLYCTISNFIAYATVAASVFTLTGISCDRYLAIVYPLQPRMSKTSSLVTIFFIWTASMVIAFPCLLYSATVSHTHRDVERVGCIMIWPDKKVVGSKYDLWYQMLFLFITYLVPMALMSMCYTIMGKVLWGSRSIGELTQRQADAIRSKRKVVKMFILVVLIFGLCWLPYHSYFIYIYYDTKVIYSKYTQHVYLSFYWFAMSNAMVNPLIYYWMNVVKMFILVVLIFGLCWLPYHSYFIYIYYDTKVIYSKYTQHVYLSFYWFAMSNAMVNPLIYYWMNARFRQYFRTAVCGWKRFFITRGFSANLQATQRYSQNSNTKSGGGGGTVKLQISPPVYRNGDAHHALLNADSDKNINNKRGSTKATRTTSLKKELQQTTYL